MAIKTLIERASTAYSIGTPVDSAQIDFRHICNNTSEFDSLKTALNQEFRREGLMTLDLSDGKVKICIAKGDGWEWRVIPFNEEVQELIKSAINVLEIGSITKINGEKANIDFTLVDGVITSLKDSINEYSFGSSSVEIAKASTSQIENLFS